MCKVLEREGREWAFESIRQLEKLGGKGDQNRQLVNYLERGLKGRPASFTKGVQSVIDQVKQVSI